MGKSKTDLLQGTLDMLVLKTLSPEPMHGWGICERIQQVSQGILDVNHGSLYPALQRLKSRGWVESSWGLTENNRRARYYELTDAGQNQLEREVEAWRRSSGAVNRILDFSWEES